MEDKICFRIEGTEETITEVRSSLVIGWLLKSSDIPKDDDEIINHRVTINDDVVMYFKTFGDLMKALSGSY